MKKWIKKDVSSEVVKEICDRYGCDALTASIFARRNITSGEDILYFIENDTRYLHNPFLLAGMEDAVDRILQAKDEGEKVLIFGDRDVDGMTATTLLYTHLCNMGIDVRWQLPLGDDAYGISTSALDEFAKDYGSLLISVDCGISNNEEITYAAELGIDVIIADHHRPPQIVPSPAIIVNPKSEQCTYPFKDICGCAVAYKLVSALRFSQFELYKQELCLLNVRPVNDSFVVEGVKIVNLAEKDRIAETIIPGMLSIQQTRLPKFLQGQQILCWDEALQKRQLEKIFGKGVEFNMLDIRNEISQMMPSLASMSLLRLKSLSKIALYQDTPSDELDAFLNLFITFASKQQSLKTGSEQDSFDVQLVALATLADIMPLKNENRILVKKGLDSMQTGKIQSGIAEIFAKVGMSGKSITSTDLSWNIIPILNAAGRLGKPERAVELLCATDSAERTRLATEVIALNEERKQKGNDAYVIAEKQAYDNLARFNNKIVFVSDERIDRGITGLLASRLANIFKVPSIVVTFLEDGRATGSVRSTCDFEIMGMLDSCADLFLNYGGHAFAGGFSFQKEKLPEFMKRIEDFSLFMEFDPDNLEEKIIIDAELPHSFMIADTMKTVDRFEPFGAENPPLVFMTKKAKITDANIMGKTERMHLKLTLDCGKNQWPAIFWGEAERLQRDFDVGDFVDIVFRMTYNTFNGNKTLQLILEDCVKST
ncbi:MAG: single-stranded-DNA-specific exonuclease RecJ [Spirochaetales bacterium]